MGAVDLHNQAWIEVANANTTNTKPGREEPG